MYLYNIKNYVNILLFSLSFIVEIFTLGCLIDAGSDAGSEFFFEVSYIGGSIKGSKMNAWMSQVILCNFFV